MIPRSVVPVFLTPNPQTIVRIQKHVQFHSKYVHVGRGELSGYHYRAKSFILDPFDACDISEDAISVGNIELCHLSQ